MSTHKQGTLVTSTKKPRARQSVVHVSSAHPWTDNRIHYRECESLAEAGYHVTLVAVASAVEGPTGRVQVVIVPRMPRLKRATVGTLRAIRLALKTDASLFHVHDPELAWAIPLLRLLGKVVVYDAHEDLPEQVRSKSYIRPWATGVAVGTAHVIVALSKLSSHVVAATETIARRYRADHVTVVHNYPPLRDEELRAPDMDARNPAVVYLGDMEHARGGQVMVDACADEAFPDGWKLEAAGTIPSALEAELPRRPGWKRTNHHGQLPPLDARDLLLRCRVGLVLLQDTPAYRDSLPTKMFEYFAAGLPVIASDFPLWRTIVTDRDCGILVDQTSPAAVAEAISRYAADPELLRKHSENARKLAREELNWEREGQALAALYDRILDRCKVRQGPTARES